ncbi:MAG TPA: hypothetical protein PKA53_05275 [Sphingobacterium sp.]|nr:hypothetical protein [Sphingobacterium sp.]
MDIRNQSGNKVENGDIVGGNKHITNIVSSGKKTKLAHLFERLKSEFDQNNRISQVSDELEKYSIPRDVIGLEQKLSDAGKQDKILNAAWLKEQYFKKLTKFQFFEPAQEIHAFLLGLVLTKFNNIIYPMINENASDVEIGKQISEQIIDPIVKLIQEEGCDDVMGLSPTDIDGMIYFLTGQCHIKWVKS